MLNLNLVAYRKLALIPSVIFLIASMGLIGGCGGPSDTVTVEQAPANPKMGTPEADAAQKEAQSQQ